MAYTQEEVQKMDDEKLVKRFRAYAATIAINGLSTGEFSVDEESYRTDTVQSTEILQAEILARLSPEYPYPVWGTQGGGLVRLIYDEYVFVKEPAGQTLHIGDTMPEEWSLAPANDLAREQSLSDRFPED